MNTGKWLEILESMEQHSNQRDFRRMMMRLFWSATVYRIWGKRNSRRLGQAAEFVNQVVCRIALDLKHKIMFLGKVLDNEVNRQICDNWGLSTSLLYVL